MKEITVKLLNFEELDDAGIAEDLIGSDMEFNKDGFLFKGEAIT